MRKAIIHLSDFHYRNGWTEAHAVVSNAFFDDLSQRTSRFAEGDVYLAFSGDTVQAGEMSDYYSSFHDEFNSKLDDLGIARSHRICVPGNHDVCTRQIAAKLVEHEGVVSQKLDENSFDEYIARPDNVFTDKFANYLAFERLFAAFGVSRDASIAGAGWEIADGIAVYCLNSALCASGGLKLRNEPLVDKGRLAIDTRSLHSWNLTCKAPVKILIMHHPLAWLSDWAQRELKTLLRKDFALCLSGHAHDQSALHSISDGSSLVECSAPPLFTTKSGDLGYSIISVDSDTGVTDIAYRQWTRHHSFVAGVSFANNDDGRVVIAKHEEGTDGAGRRSPKLDVDIDFVDRYLAKRLDKALLAFSSQPRIWVEPIVRKSPEVAIDAEAASRIPLAGLINTTVSRIIKAPPQFGLTCLAYHLAREAWRTEKALWLYLDARDLKPHAGSIERATKSELDLLGHDLSDVKCVVLDSWTSHEKHSFKLLEKVCTVFPGIPLVVMQTVDETQFVNRSSDVKLDRTFEMLYLWALPRENVRKVVAGYNETRHIGDEDALTARVVADLMMLNIPRTPLNCLTLLKVSEIDFDQSPVNRTEMIRRVLFLLFNADDIPSYKARPDLQDCEYVLGYLTETILKEDNYYFTREHFIRLLHAFCRERFIDLEVQVVFDVLHDNNILIKRGELFCFKFAYWIYYFAAQRMHHDQKFADYIFQDMRYARFPEIIEFYTGIDRRREDALRMLIRDIRAASEKVQKKISLPEGLNPYKFAQWRPSPTMLEQMQSEIACGVLDSNLPEAVKDRYADRQYDRARPYCQEIEDILTEHSFIYMMGTMKAGAKALRNSDYVDPDVRRHLLQEILSCWDQGSRVLLVMAPLLAERGQAAFEGALFLLAEGFGARPEQRFLNILFAIPQNVVSWCQDDLFSHKMGPLLIDQFAKERHDLKKHELALLLIEQRPRGWQTQIQNYIAATPKNAFYLLDVYLNLRAQYRYSYASPRTLSEIEYLIKMAAAKHQTGTKIPGVKMIGKVSDTILPPREVDKTS